MGYTDADWKAINTIRLLAVCSSLPRHSQYFFDHRSAGHRYLLELELT